MSANAHFAVQRNAFSTAAAAAKVCDGLISYSIAERIASATTSSSAKGYQLFALLPSIHGHVASYQEVTTDQSSGSIVYTGDLNIAPTVHAIANVVAATTAQVAAQPVTSPAGVDDDANMEGQTTGAAVVAPTVSQQTTIGLLEKKADAPDQYRLVSAALRLSPINASDSNNGWFEAVRVRSSFEKNGFKVINATFVPDTDGFEDGILSDRNWANDPSYVTGRLRELGKHTFYLQPTGPRTFKKWPTKVNLNAFDSFSEQPCGMDTDFDIVLIRVYSASSTTDTLKQTLHVHTVKNWETVYDGKHPMSRFHTSTIAYKKGVEYCDKQMTRDPKASMIRSASSYAYKY